MALLELAFYPNPVLKKPATTIPVVNDAVKTLAADMLETMYDARGLGLAGPMVGRSERIFVIDLQDDGVKAPKTYINPEIVWASDELQEVVEASLSYPGIEAPIARPKAIKVAYTNLDGEMVVEEADGFLATVIQHEMDYLEGKSYLDLLKPVKRNLLITRMQKYMKRLARGSHVHGPGCGHDHDHDHDHDHGHVHGPNCNH